MSTAISHWGFLKGFVDEAESAGSYEAPSVRPSRPEVGLVLTEAGEVLINRHCKESECYVAIVIGRLAHGLSRPQTERMQRAWDMALAVANGHAEAVQLQPMPHHWRFSRADYLTIDEWQALHTPNGASRAQQNGAEARR